MSGEATGGGSGSGRDDDDPFAIRPATDADRERPARPLAPIGWGRAADRDAVPAEHEDADGVAGDPDDATAAAVAAQEQGFDPAPADPPQAPEGDILAGIVPLDPTEDVDRIAPLDQADASADADPADEAPAPAPEPEIADAPFIADDLELGEPDPGYAPAEAPHLGSPSDDAPLTGEVLTGEVEADPEPVDDATAELVLEPIDDGAEDLRLPEPAAQPAAESAVVDAELVDDPAPEQPSEPSADESVQLTPLRDEGFDEDAEVVDDPVGAADAPAAAAPAALEAPAGEDEIVDPVPAYGADDDRDDDRDDVAPAPLAPAAAAARAAAMAWAAGSAPAAAPASAAPAGPAASAAPAAPAAPDVDDRALEPAAVSAAEAPAPDEHPATAVLAAPTPEVAPDAGRRPVEEDPRDRAADRDAAASPDGTAAADAAAADRDAAASDDEPVDALALLFGDAAEDPTDDRRTADDADDDRSAPAADEDRTHVLPAVGAAAAVAGAAAPAAHPRPDAATAAVPAAPRPDAASRPAPVPPPYVAPAASAAPRPPAPVRDDARVPGPPAPPRSASGTRGPRRTGLWVGGAILLVLLLVGLFYLGQRLTSSAAPDAAPAATATAEASPTPSPTPTDPVQGPAAAGPQAWDALLGGECIDPYTTPWEEEFTVVDCGSEHHAQMVARVALPQTGDAFPGEDVVRDSADELCIADTVIDYGAARAYEDVQYQSAYPITQDEWAAGDRDAYCFVSRAGGGTFTGSIGKPQPPVVP
ncbi:septum formation family protein [Clavibacter sp. km3a]|uniref:septum formation family protein n=1 Tax=Clavibacter sp. km3a TaxID=3459135 RepID=UPI00404369A7